MNLQPTITEEHKEMIKEAGGRICGAKTRAGTPCKQKGIYTNGRCKLHGGLSTGPRTEEGKKKAALNGLKGGRPKKV